MLSFAAERDESDVYSSHSFMRAGWMAAFDTFESFQQYSDDVLKLIEDFSTPSHISSKVMDALEAAEAGSDGNRLSTSINVSMSDPVARTPAETEADESEC